MKQFMKSFTLLLTLTTALAGCGGGGSGGSGAIAPANPNVAFVTSASGKGNLNSWPAAGGATGLAAGDSICQAAATAAGLPGTYRAWLSTSTVDAYCHVQGYTGTIANNCGQTTLPTAAGPWVRRDGHPFAGTIANLVNNGQVFAPVRYDESGTLLTDRIYFTGTSDDGTVSNGHCVNWTDDTSVHFGLFGSTELTTYGWTSYGGVGCNGSLRLLCMQTGAGGPLPAMTPPAGAKRVFVTSTAINGNLGGITGGDAICQARAAAGSVPNPTKFKAWLSDGSTGAITRLNSSGPWYRLDGVKVADNKTALATVPLFTAITYTEAGTYVKGPVHTGTGVNGLPSGGGHCVSWTSNLGSENGTSGYSVSSHLIWTNWYERPCDQTARLYCFEDD